MGSLWYFAYGSNMASSTLRGRREVHPSRAVPARVAGWRFVLDKPGLVPVGHSFANIVADERSEVLGVLFAVSSADLEHIELTEGVRIGNYNRVEVTATPLAGDAASPVPAFSLSSDRRDSTLRPSRRYMDLLVAGALEHHLPASYVDFLRSVPTVPESEEAARLRSFVEAGLRRR